MKSTETNVQNTQRLMQELQTHQVELLAQNEALRQAQSELQDMRNRYVDLYEFAPVGFCTLNMDGMIDQINLTAVVLLSGERHHLLDHHFLNLVLPQDHLRWNKFFTALKTQGGRGSVKLTLRRMDESLFFVQLDCHLARGGPTAGAGDTVRIAIADVTEMEQAQVALKAALKDKDALLKEVHHRVKNNLQVILSLLRLEAGRTPVADTKTVLATMQGRIHAMSQLHESLYRTDTFAAVDLGFYLGQLASQAFRTQMVHGDFVRLRLNLGSVTVGMDLAICCGLLVNELVSNCLKHGFPDGHAGEIHVALHPADPLNPSADALWCLRVSDSGVGLPPDFEAKRAHSLGLQLAGDMCRQIGSVLEIASQPGQGTEFSLVLTVPPPVPQHGIL